MGTKILRLFLLVLFFLSMTLLAQEAIEESKAKQLSISGNKTFSNVTLLNFLGLDFSKRQIVKEKIKVTEPECLDITDNLFSFYRKEGFFDVSIEKNESEEAFEIALMKDFLTQFYLLNLFIILIQRLFNKIYKGKRIN